MQRFQISPLEITGSTLAFEVVYNAMLSVGVESRGEFGLLLLALVLLMLAPLAMEVSAFLASPAQKTRKGFADVK